MSYISAISGSITSTNICRVLSGVPQVVNAIPQVTGAITSLTLAYYIISPHKDRLFAAISGGASGTSDDVVKRLAYRTLASEFTHEEKAKLDAAERHAKKLAKESSLPQFCTDLTSDVVARAKARELSPYTRRENIELSLLTVLAKTDSASSILEGESGAGKTSLVDHLALQAAIDPQHPLHKYRFVRLCVRDFKVDKGGLYRQIEAFLKKGEAACFADIIKKLNQEGNLILVLDELQSLVSGHHNFFSDFKTILSEGRVRIIGTTTDERMLDRLFEYDSDQVRRFERIYVPTLDLEGASQIIYDQLIQLDLPITMGSRPANSSAETKHNRKRLADAICYFSDGFPGVFPAKASSFLQRLKTYYATKKREAQSRGIENLPLSIEHVVELYQTILSTSKKSYRTSIKELSNTDLLAQFQAKFIDHARLDNDLQVICNEQDIKFEPEASSRLSGLFSADLSSIASSLDKSGLNLSSKPIFSISNFNSIFHTDLIEKLKSIPGENRSECLTISLEYLSKFLLSVKTEEEAIMLLKKLREKLEEFKAKSDSYIIFTGCEVLELAIIEFNKADRSPPNSRREKPSCLESLSSNSLVQQAGQLVQSVTEPFTSMGLLPADLHSELSGASDWSSKTVGSTADDKELTEASSKSKKHHNYLLAVHSLIKGLKGCNVILCSSGNSPLSMNEMKVRCIDTAVSYREIRNFLKEALVKRGLSGDIADDIIFYGLYHGGESFGPDQAHAILTDILVSADEARANIPVQQIVIDHLSSSKLLIETSSRDITVMEESVTSSDPLLELIPYQSLICRLIPSMSDSLATYFELKESCVVRAGKFFAALKNSLLQENTLVFDLNLRSVMSKPFSCQAKLKLLKQGLEFMFKKAQSQNLPAVIIVDPSSSDVDIAVFQKVFKRFDENYIRGEGPEIKIVFRERPVYASMKAASAPVSQEETLGALQQLALKSVQNTAIGAAASTLASAVLSGEKPKTEETEGALDPEDENEVFNLSQVEREEMQALIEEGMAKQKIKWPSLLNLYVQLYNEKKYTIGDILKLERVVCKKDSYREAVAYLSSGRVNMHKDDIHYYCSYDSFYARFKRRVSGAANYLASNWTSIVWKVGTVASTAMTSYYVFSKCCNVVRKFSWLGKVGADLISKFRK